MSQYKYIKTFVAKIRAEYPSLKIRARKSVFDKLFPELEWNIYLYDLHDKEKGTQTSTELLIVNGQEENFLECLSDSGFKSNFFEPQLIYSNTLYPDAQRESEIFTKLREYINNYSFEYQIVNSTFWMVDERNRESFGVDFIYSMVKLSVHLAVKLKLNRSAIEFSNQQISEMSKDINFLIISIVSLELFGEKEYYEEIKSEKVLFIKSDPIQDFKDKYGFELVKIIQKISKDLIIKLDEHFTKHPFVKLSIADLYNINNKESYSKNWY